MGVLMVNMWVMGRGCGKLETWVRGVGGEGVGDGWIMGLFMVNTWVSGRGLMKI